MSTRSVVAKVEGDGFVGRYCHSDGYPTARGRELFQTYRDLGNAEAVIKYAVREGESGYWSSFCPPSANPQEVDRSTPEGEHDFQNQYKLRYHFNWCYEEDNTDLIRSWGDDWGTEWAYVIAENGLSVFKRDYASKTWRLIGTYKWNEEPDWEAVERLAYPEDEG